jgi:hypothetical protein
LELAASKQWGAIALLVGVGGSWCCQERGRGKTGDMGSKLGWCGLQESEMALLDVLVEASGKTETGLKRADGEHR